MELPSSWQLKQEKTSGGQIAVTGVDARGEKYVVRKCADGVSERDVASIAASDREKVTPRERVRMIMSAKESYDKAQESSLRDSLADDALAIARAGFGVKSFGYSRSYAMNFDRVFKGMK